jgi:hypothetical protein
MSKKLFPAPSSFPHNTPNDLGGVAEWLALLWRVDPGNANPMLILVGIENRDRIAIGDFNDDAFEGASFRE